MIAEGQKLINCEKKQQKAEKVEGFWYIRAHKTGEKTVGGGVGGRGGVVGAQTLWFRKTEVTFRIKRNPVLLGSRATQGAFTGALKRASETLRRKEN